MRIVVLIILYTILLAPAAFAQHDEVQTLAHRLAIDIAATGKKRVAVADFGGPGDGMTQLGKVLSMELTASLAWTDRELEASQTPLLQRALNENGILIKDQGDPRVARSLGEKAGADIVVLGWIESDGIRVTLTVWAANASDGARVSEQTATIPKTQAVDALLAKRLHALVVAPRAAGGCEPFGLGVHTPGRNGVSFPKCTFCPNPPYSDEGRAAHVSGSVRLQLVVTESGRAEQVRVVESLGSGLDENAAATVAKWRFDPATDKGGKPVNACLVVEVNYRIR